MLDCDEAGGARVSRRTRECPETRAGSGEPELEKGVSKTYLRVPADAKLGESVPVTQLALAVVGMLSTHKSGLSHGRGPAFQGERSDVAPGLLSWQEQPKGWQEEKALC